MRKIIIKLIVIISFVIISACSMGSNPGLLVIHDLGPAKEQTLDAVIVTLNAPVWLWDERIRYRLIYDDATVIHYYNLDRWEAPLPTLLERRLTINGKQRPIKLQIQLVQFEQQFVTVSRSRVVMELIVSALSSVDYNLLEQQSFLLSKKAGTANAAGAIAGFIALTEQAKIDIESWLEALPDEDIVAH